MRAHFFARWDDFVGRSPWSARVPPDPLFAQPDQPQPIRKSTTRPLPHEGAVRENPESRCPHEDVRGPSAPPPNAEANAKA